jgi:hypothetical protein
MSDRATLGPAEQIIQTMLRHADHLYHGRPGIVRPEPSVPGGVIWASVTHRRENGVDVVYSRGARRLGVREGENIVEGGAVVGRYQPAGLFPEMAEWLYRQVAEVYRLDNEFAARWASYANAQDHRDMKVVLTAFMLVQDRYGMPTYDGGALLFRDQDFREVGEAMALDLAPKQLLRVRALLAQVASINRALGFGTSPRSTFYGRWPKVVRAWLRHRELNPKMLDGLVRAGYRESVRRLAQLSSYEPKSAAFYRALRWKQTQAKTGHRTIAIGETMSGDSWAGLTEAEVCARIQRERPSWLSIVGRLPPEVGLTRAVVVAVVTARGLSPKELVNLTPTLEEFGLLTVEPIQSRWQAALATVEDQRAANIAKNVRTATTRAALETAAEGALKRAVAEVVRGLRIYFLVDISGSMTASIDVAKRYVAQLVHAFPEVHVAVFNTLGRRVLIPHPSAQGVEQAFRGFAANGGTDYGAGVRAVAEFKPAANEDALFIFVGDEEASSFPQVFETVGIRPAAFGLVRLGQSRYTCVQDTAKLLGIPCFQLTESTFVDPYALPRTLRALIQSTPVGASRPARETLIDLILKTKLLEKPRWAT